MHVQHLTNLLCESVHAPAYLCAYVCARNEFNSCAKQVGSFIFESAHEKKQPRLLVSQFLERPTQRHRSARRSLLRLDFTKPDKHRCYVVIACMINCDRAQFFGGYFEAVGGDQIPCFFNHGRSCAIEKRVVSNAIAAKHKHFVQGF
jgi:hypothetical protein